MKRKLSFFLMLSLLVGAVYGCAPGTVPAPDGNGSTSAVPETDAPETDAPITLPEIVGEKIQLQSEQWVAFEVTLTSDRTYSDPLAECEVDALFLCRETGEHFTMPAFFDGGTTWRIRAALPAVGTWDFCTVCTVEEDSGLSHRGGTVTCTPYGGDLPIYQHGFVRTGEGLRYFIYDDGTPFFYLGDTHWTLPLEEIDGVGGLDDEIAASEGITSQFYTIMDYRAAQGYTVIQSQQLGRYEGRTGNSWLGDSEGSIFDYGINDLILGKLQQLDRYFAYIAKLGFVHAHTQFSYPEELIESVNDGKIDEEGIRRLCRYWVARYSAYPVMWTTAQEGDDNYYSYEGCTRENNPWKTVMQNIVRYDPYHHPATCHMENANATKASGSVFATLEGHNWFAAQYNFDLKNGTVPTWTMLRDFYTKGNGKPVVKYEGRYDHYWIGTSGARAQGWLAYLCGNCGYGYGAQPIWNIFWAEIGGDQTTNENSDIYESYSCDVNWWEGLHLEAGQQLTYMKGFFERYDWWNLVPCFKSSDYFLASGTNYAVATVENRLYIGYFYGAEAAGRFTKMENADYTWYWFNCRTGEQTETQTVTVTDGTFAVPEKPDGADWAIAVVLAEGRK